MIKYNKDIEGTYNAKIGLMYVSDYVYASAPESWLNNTFEIRKNIWLNNKRNEWAITRLTNANYNKYAYSVYESGYIDAGNEITTRLYIRPTFYLVNDIKYQSGSGSENNPIRLN